MTQPIRPGEIAARKLDLLPEAVIETFNDLIAKHYTGGSAKVSQEEVVNELLARSVIEERQEAFDRHLLDVEPVYRAAGWKVTYDTPGYNESGRAIFIFAQDER